MTSDIEDNEKYTELASRGYTSVDLVANGKPPGGSFVKVFGYLLIKLHPLKTACRLIRSWNSETETLLHGGKKKLMTTPPQKIRPNI